MAVDQSGVEPSEDESAPELPLVTLAREAVLNRIRQASRIDFWEETMDWRLSPREIPAFLGLKKGHGYSPRALCAGLKKAKSSYDSFSIEVTTKTDEKGIEVCVRLKDGCEWQNVWEEAWRTVPTPNEHCLSDNAVKLLRWARSGKNTGEPIDQDRIMRQAQLRGHYLEIRDCFREIQVKAEPLLAFDRRTSGGPMTVRFCEAPGGYYDVGPLNPALALSLTEAKREDLLRFRNWLYAEIRRLELPKDNEVIGVFEIADRRMLKSCFASWPRGFSWDSTLREFFKAVQVMEGFNILTLFDQGLGPWLVGCRLSDGWTWSRVKAWLNEREAGPPAAEKYGLSSDAASLLEWIADLRTDQYLGNLTPALEECLERDIGLKPEWPKENLSAYFGMLVDEINEKTDFDLKVQPWRRHSGQATRIQVRRKLHELDQIVRLIQVLGASRNQMLEPARVRAAVESLLS